MPKTTYLDTAVLNAALRNTPFTPPTLVYVALYTVSPTNAGGGTEVVGGAYVRQPVTFSVPSGGAVQNIAGIVYPTATAAWGTVIAFAFLDSPSAGNMLYYGSLSSPRTVQQYDQIKFPAGLLTASES